MVCWFSGNWTTQWHFQGIAQRLDGPGLVGADRDSLDDSRWKELQRSSEQQANHR
jgi:hypothetical protein